MSTSVTDSIVIQKNVMVPMRDGTALATDIYRQNGETATPVLLQRTPYDKDYTYVSHILRMVRAGYTVVVQDARGRFASEGEFVPFTHEADDGADAIAWTARQPWSNGRIGMIGASYVGATQWLAATEAPPALQGIAPYITASDYHDGWTYQGGAFELGFNLSWSLGFALTETLRRVGRGQATTSDRERVLDAIDAITKLYTVRPLVDIDVLKDIAPYYDAWLQHPDDDEYWQRLAPSRHHEQITVPAMNMGGWYDIFLGGTLANYCGMKAHGGSAAARAGQRLIIGPWGHGVDGGFFPTQDFGTRAGSGSVTVDLIGAQLRWFDYILKGIASGTTERPVRLFIMGANIWRDADDWPLPDTIYRPYYLHSNGQANSLRGNGMLSVEQPAAEPPDIYLYDPRNPVPTVGGPTLLPGMVVGANSGPRDQQIVEERSDVLCYSTLPLERAVEVTGPVTLVLYISSSARDTDFTGKLVDVAPDGRATILTEGIMRARYRESFTTPRLLEPEHVHELHIDLWATANVFAAGHRIRLDVSSSNFPRFDCNTNTGGVIAQDRTEDVVQAVNRVYHDSTHPSYVLLPFIERD